MNENNILEFLKELSALTLKYKVRIHGCGCCGSPFLLSIDEYKNELNLGYCVNKKLKYNGNIEYEDLIFETWDKIKEYRITDEDAYLFTGEEK